MGLREGASRWVVRVLTTWRARPRIFYYPSTPMCAAVRRTGLVSCTLSTEPLSDVLKVSLGKKQRKYCQVLAADRHNHRTVPMVSSALGSPHTAFLWGRCSSYFMEDRVHRARGKAALLSVRSPGSQEARGNHLALQKALTPSLGHPRGRCSQAGAGSLFPKHMVSAPLVVYS